MQLVNLLRQDLGAGESEAIVLAREVKADVLLMDERRGRNAAKRLGITCTGLVGLLLEARRRGICQQQVPHTARADRRATVAYMLLC